MKKLFSVVLAAVLALSLCVTSFAAFDFNAFIEDLKKEGANIAEMIKGLTPEDAKKVLEEAVAQLSDADLAEILGKLDTSNIAGSVDDALAAIEEKTGISVDELKGKLADSEIFNLFANLYIPATPTTTEEPTVPATGSSIGGIAVFATLSIAAAAAFVCAKKK